MPFLSLLWLQVEVVHMTLCLLPKKARTGYRSHSPKYVVDEIEHLIRDYGVKDIAFVDSLFVPTKDAFMRFVMKLSVEDCKINFLGPVLLGLKSSIKLLQK